jgi:DNA-binding GntR family transcriptional regulator
VEKSAAFYALTRLTADGLVRRDPDRGYVIVPFDTRTSDETFDARCAIELAKQRVRQILAQTGGRL